MARLNMFLLMVAVFCALSVVTSQHKARKLFQSLESEQERAKQLDVEGFHVSGSPAAPWWRAGKEVGVA